jgi:dipeptidyl-peptidase-4
MTTPTRTKSTSRLALAALPLAAIFCAAAEAQQPGHVYTANDYAEAERFMQYNVDPLVSHTVEHPTWLADGRLLYRDSTPEGYTLSLVDPARGTVTAAFDHRRIATELTDALHSNAIHLPVAIPVDPNHLPVDELAFETNRNAVILTIAGERIRCDLQAPKGGCSSAEFVPRPAEPMEISPDRSKGAFVRQNNLWLRDLHTGKDTQLTTDGLPNFGYATDNAGWRRSPNAIVVWSPDSNKIATFQLDLREAGRMARVSTAAGHPAIDMWKYPLAGDAKIASLQRVIVDLSEAEKPKVIRLDTPPDLHRSTLCDDLACTEGHGWDDVQWSEDSTRLAYVSTSRDHKHETLRIANAATGAVRDVMSEDSPTYFESGVTKVCWRFLSRSNEILWYSQRDDWGQLYLYDAATGKLKNGITHGVGNVTELIHVDETARTILFLAAGKDPAWDPYFTAAYRVQLDGSGLKLLTPSNATHDIVASRDGRQLLDIASTPTTPQTATVIDRDGKTMVRLPRQDINRLQSIGWVPLMPFTVKARDSKTDLYGFMFRPTHFDPAARYPIVDLVYPGPQTGSCGARSFAAAHRDMQSLAELGFVVVCIDGTGTPYRSKSFHDAHYGDMGDNTIPDQIAGIRELAGRFAWIDLNRVGIYGHSGGGAATAAAMFHFPDFFKVGVSESGNHDNRVYEDDWAERYQGLLVRNADGTTNYDNQANQLAAKNLKGHLLLMHGTMDDNVPPSNTLLVVRALMDANKDFDLLMIPNAVHGYGQYGPYTTRRRWDYFVRYLANGIPPAEYPMRRFSEQ